MVRIELISIKWHWSQLQVSRLFSVNPYPSVRLGLLLGKELAFKSHSGQQSLLAST